MVVLCASVEGLFFEGDRTGRLAPARPVSITFRWNHSPTYLRRSSPRSRISMRFPPTRIKPSSSSLRKLRDRLSMMENSQNVWTGFKGGYGCSPDAILSGLTSPPGRLFDPPVTADDARDRDVRLRAFYVPYGADGDSRRSAAVVDLVDRLPVRWAARPPHWPTGNFQACRTPYGADQHSDRSCARGCPASV